MLPRPAANTKASEIYAAVKAGLVRFFSAGGLWSRKTIAGRTYLGCRRLIEISLTSAPANVHARTAGVTAVTGVKSIGGVWIADSFEDRWDSAVSAHRLRDLAREVALAELALDVAALRLT